MDGRACVSKPLADTAVVEGVAYYRVPYGPPPDVTVLAESHRALWTGWPDSWPAHCRDCATPQGGLHHPGCDAERCPRCLGQAISCGCRWDNDEPDPEFDPGWLPYPSPLARRAQRSISG